MLIPMRQKSMFPQPKAAAVLRTTMGFSTGAASRKAMPAGRGNPYLKEAGQRYDPALANREDKPHQRAADR